MQNIINSYGVSGFGSAADIASAQLAGFLAEEKLEAGQQIAAEERILERTAIIRAAASESTTVGTINIPLRTATVSPGIPAELAKTVGTFLDKPNLFVTTKRITGDLPAELAIPGMARRIFEGESVPGFLEFSGDPVRQARLRAQDKPQVDLSGSGAGILILLGLMAAGSKRRR